jgi:hypothetical protein
VSRLRFGAKSEHRSDSCHAADGKEAGDRRGAAAGSTRWGEYSPSRRNREPIAPGSVARPGLFDNGELVLGGELAALGFGYDLGAAQAQIHFITGSVIQNAHWAFSSQ